MSGFSTAMMSGLMRANTALTSAKAHTNVLSHMDSQKNILESQIQSGVGDVEGKKAELEDLKERRAYAESMQNEALNVANSSLGNAAITEEETKPEVGTKDDKTASDEAKNEARTLEKKNPEHDVASVDYKNGMQIAGEDGKTAVAVSPGFLEKMSQSPALEDAYSGFMGTMRALEESGPSVSSQTWAVDGDGIISRHAEAAAETSDADLASMRLAMQKAGAEAFGSLYGTTTVARAAAAAKADLAASTAGVLVDVSI